MSATLAEEQTLPATFDEAACEALITQRGESETEAQRRRSALRNYESLQAQELDPEEWRRVELRPLKPENFSVSKQAGQADFATRLGSSDEFGGRAVHVDGHATEISLDPELAEQGVIFGDLHTVMRQHGDLLEPHFMTHAVKAETDRFTAWHAAFVTGGTVLYVPKGVQVEKPLHSLIGLTQGGAADFSHTLVILEDGASAALLEETASSTEEPGLHVGAVELILGKEARLRYVQLQNWNTKTFHLAHQVGRVERDANLQWTVGGLGSRLAHVHQDVHLDGRGAHAEVNGVTFSTNRQQLSYYTEQNHNAPDTTSDLLYKTVLRDKSKVVWRGMIKVEKEAQRTDGYQRCDSLMLSDTARSDSIPGLEIEADDVRCTHGATTGKVDEEQIFYCMSRGVGRSEAMHMIVEGFFQHIYDRIPVEAVREVLDDAVQKKLGIGE
ncbi:Fe-S cluster assembly protein SufD [Stratiformator vulcanicus]|uniref:FeS cluster assembly protein SufB n=1 Tax=Stratiformator vulcanicus TaxID=2527980 RepID=A0A517R337_9PLAN|nr:Fe-S cluster assembly protein SufD [Stratiformator vulcanicus]QDT38300.1 FeS cluster assembly protein SufB [Stratiformator vulcanicus]